MSVTTPPNPDKGVLLVWSEDNQKLAEYLLLLSSNRGLGLHSYTKTQAMTGQEIQNLLRELFDKPDLVIQAWDWSDRDNS